MGLAKCFTTIGALFMLLFGIGVVGGTAYLWINDDFFLGNTNFKYTFLGISLGVGILVVLGAADGMYGICKVKPCHLCIFQIFVIICMVVFIAVGIMFMVSTDVVFQGTCKVSKNTVIEEAYNLYDISATTFCKGPCPCYLNQNTPEFSQRYTLDERATLNDPSKFTLSADPSAAVTTGSCQNVDIADAEKSLFKNIEELYECSLWCTDDYSFPNLIYRFRDINKGRPKSYCYQRLKDWYESVKSVAGGSFIGAGAIMTLMFICNAYLCCCAKSRKDRDLRGRFLYYNEREQDYNNYDRLDRYGGR